MANAPGPVQQAQAILAGQYRPIDYAHQVAAANAAKEQAALQAASLALVKQLQGGVSQAAPLYDAAIGQQQALAQAGANLLAQANPNASVQHTLSQIGAPAEQSSQIAGNLGAQFPGQGAVLNVMQGTVPGVSLVAQKAAEQAHLAGLPTVAALQGQQNLRSLLAQSAAERAKYVQDRLQVAGQLPGLVTQLQQRAQDVQYRNQQAANALREAAINRQFQAGQAERDRQFRAQQAAIDFARSQAISPLQQAQLDMEQKRLNAEIRASNAKATQTVKNGGLTPYESASLNERKREFNIRTSQKKNTPTSARGFTPYQIQRYKGTATTIAGNARAGFTDAKGNVHPPLTYNDAVKEMEKEGIPLTIAVAALNQMYPAQYRVTKRGLKQTGIKGQPSTFGPQGYVAPKPKRKKG